MKLTEIQKFNSYVTNLIFFFLINMYQRKSSRLAHMRLLSRESGIKSMGNWPKFIFSNNFSTNWSYSHVVDKIVADIFNLLLQQSTM